MASLRGTIEVQERRTRPRKLRFDSSHDATDYNPYRRKRLHFVKAGSVDDDWDIIYPSTGRERGRHSSVVVQHAEPELVVEEAHKEEQNHVKDHGQHAEGIPHDGQQQSSPINEDRYTPRRSRLRLGKDKRISRPSDEENLEKVLNKSIKDNKPLATQSRLTTLALSACSFGLASNRDIKAPLAAIGASSINNGPLVKLARKERISILRYGRQKDSEDLTFQQHEIQKPCAYAYTREMSLKMAEVLQKLEPMAGEEVLRVIHIQGNLEAMERLTEIFPIQFNRNRTKFLDWSRGPKLDIDSYIDSRNQNLPKVEAQKQLRDRREAAIPAWQTAFWRPVLDPGTKMLRTAFGMEYMIPQSTETATLETHQDSQHRASSFKTASPEEARSQSNNNYQRLSVYLQLKRTRLEDPPSLVIDSEGELASPALPQQNTLIVFDSMNKQARTDELILGSEPWRELTDEMLVGSMNHSNDLAVAAIHLLFDAIAGKWSEYILRMHGFISALAEDIYDQPANDEPTSALWRVSKQLLQAERLLNSHIQLAETIQIELRYFAGPHPLEADWLHQDLEEFKRLSDEVEKTLQKPVAHMLDLMYKSISIRDARQSLELNTSLWRLSWITFIFLPLTFLAGIFGMNVEELHNNPQIKWYFIVAVPLMVLVMSSWMVTSKLMRKGVGP